MKRTFREFFLAIDPKQRAQIVLRVVMSRHQQLGFTRDHAKITFDAAEYLPDEQTIVAYLALVEELRNPSLYRLAAADAERARLRIANEQIQSEQLTIAKPGKVQWVSRNMLGRTYHFPLLGNSAPPAFSGRSANKAGSERAQPKHWAPKPLSKEPPA